MTNKSTKKFSIAVVGGTGLVGRELIDILEQRQFPISSCRIFASENSHGEEISLQNMDIRVEPLTEHSFDKIDIAFFATSEFLSKKYVPLAVSKGAICIDKSSAFRLDNRVPLIVPEVNFADVNLAKISKIIAVPNCTTTPIAQILAPLDKKYDLKRAVICTYQATSGAGREGFKELETQVRDLLNFRDVNVDIFKQRIAFNVIPAIPTTDVLVDDGYTSEEQKLIDELPKILNKQVGITATCARVPVFNGHSAALHLEFNKQISLDDARELLQNSPGLEFINKDHLFGLPTPEHANGKDVTLFGRLRVDASVPHGLSLWMSSDNLRTGAALSAVRIAEQIRGVLL